MNKYAESSLLDDIGVYVQSIIDDIDAVSKTYYECVLPLGRHTSDDPQRLYDAVARAKTDTDEALLGLQALRTVTTSDVCNTAGDPQHLGCCAGHDMARSVHASLVSAVHNHIGDSVYASKDGEHYCVVTIVQDSGQKVHYPGLPAYDAAMSGITGDRRAKIRTLRDTLSSHSLHDLLDQDTTAAIAESMTGIVIPIDSVCAVQYWADSYLPMNVQPSTKAS